MGSNLMRFGTSFQHSTMKPLSINYFGLPLAAERLLKDGHDIRLAVLPPVEGPGRWRLKKHLGDNCIDLLEEEVPPEHILEKLNASGAELLLSWFWTRLIPKAWLELHPLGGINSHPSLLPRFKGPNPYFHAIDAGEHSTGVSLHQMEEQYDEGLLLAQDSLVIGERNSWQLARALDRLSLRQLLDFINIIHNDRQAILHAYPQTGEETPYAQEPRGAELSWDSSWPTERILRRLRALSPVPGLALKLNGLAFFATNARLGPKERGDLSAGQLFSDGNRLLLGCSDGTIEISSVVFDPEASSLEAINFLRSYADGQSVPFCETEPCPWPKSEFARLFQSYPSP